MSTSEIKTEPQLVTDIDHVKPKIEDRLEQIEKSEETSVLRDGTEAMGSDSSKVLRKKTLQAEGGMDKRVSVSEDQAESDSKITNAEQVVTDRNKIGEKESVKDKDSKKNSSETRKLGWYCGRFVCVCPPQSLPPW